MTINEVIITVLFLIEILPAVFFAVIYFVESQRGKKRQEDFLSTADKMLKSLDDISKNRIEIEIELKKLLDETIKNKEILDGIQEQS